MLIVTIQLLIIFVAALHLDIIALVFKEAEERKVQMDIDRQIREEEEERMRKQREEERKEKEEKLAQLRKEREDRLKRRKGMDKWMIM